MQHRVEEAIGREIIRTKGRRGLGKIWKEPLRKGCRQTQQLEAYRRDAEVGMEYKQVGEMGVAKECFRRQRVTTLVILKGNI